MPPFHEQENERDAWRRQLGMTGRLRVLLVLLVASVAFVGLHRLDRALGSPVVSAVKGSRTVASVLRQTQAAGLGLTEEERGWVESLTLVGLKSERLLEVWGHGKGGRLERIRSYRFTAYSGGLGPKLREGDGQIPEGVYRVEHLNPNSSYHLSIKLDYPNTYDREKGAADGRKHLGFDIFIHGRSVTIGCIAIGDEAIEDLFTLVAQVGTRKVETVIAPWDFRTRKDTPGIDGIGWVTELYDRIREAMRPFAASPEKPD